MIVQANQTHDWQTIDLVLDRLPPDDIWAWVDIDPDRRAWYLASFVPKDLLRYRETSSLVREALRRYGDR